MLFEFVLYLEIRLAHLDEGLRIVAAGDHTAVVVAEDYDRRLGQIGPEYALTAGVKAVAIDQCENWRARHDCGLCL